MRNEGKRRHLSLCTGFQKRVSRGTAKIAEHLSPCLDAFDLEIEPEVLRYFLFHLFQKRLHDSHKSVGQKSFPEPIPAYICMLTSFSTSDSRYRMSQMAKRMGKHESR